MRETGMPNAGSIWDTRMLKSVVAEWYGMASMPMRVMTREEEIDGFVGDHPELPEWALEAINHSVRQVFLWLRRPDVDILVWDDELQKAKLVQDICFKDAYETHEAWRDAVLALVKDPARTVWIVFHE